LIIVINQEPAMNTQTALKPSVLGGLGLKESSRLAVLTLLDRTLADEYVLYTKTRNFHWNVEGPRFSELHKFFEAQYEQLSGIVDEVAERSRALEGRSMGSMKEFLGKARLKESTELGLVSEDMLSELATDHESLIRSLRSAIDDCSAERDHGTADLLTGLIGRHEKMAWMLRSFLK
jgi:starvation-inducible DNA-binding protein